MQSKNCFVLLSLVSLLLFTRKTTHTDPLHWADVMKTWTRPRNWWWSGWRGAMPHLHQRHCPPDNWEGSACWASMKEKKYPDSRQISKKKCDSSPLFHLYFVQGSGTPLCWSTSCLKGPFLYILLQHETNGPVLTPAFQIFQSQYGRVLRGFANAWDLDDTCHGNTLRTHSLSLSHESVVPWMSPAVLTISYWRTLATQQSWNQSRWKLKFPSLRQAEISGAQPASTRQWTGWKELWISQYTSKNDLWKSMKYFTRVKT